jgi:hypothetical protein
MSIHLDSPTDFAEDSCQGKTLQLITPSHQRQRKKGFILLAAGFYNLSSRTSDRRENL